MRIRIVSGVNILLVPGFNGSGPDHWQTLWQFQRQNCNRVEQASWHDPDPERWTAAIDTAAAQVSGHIVLVAHSLGCATVAHWATRSRNVARIAGALLVAPCDVERAGLPGAIRRFAPLPHQSLPFRSSVVASSNDPYAALPRARAFARDWGSAFVDAGALGHINAASGLGAWPFGQVLLDGLIATVDADRSPYRRAAGLRGNAIPAATPF